MDTTNPYIRNTRPSARALAFMFANWRAFVLFGDENALHKAKHAVFTAFGENPASIRLCLAAAFLHIQSENFETAQDLLNRVHPYRHYYKTNDPDVFMILQYLSACAGREGAGAKTADKSWRAICETEIKAGAENGLREALLGSLALERDMPGNPFELFEESYARGFRGTFLFVNVAVFLLERRALEGFRELLVRFLAWATRLGPAAGHMVGLVLEHYEENMSFYYFDDNLLDVYKSLADIHPKPWLLRGVCNTLIDNGDDSLEALRYYKAAQRGQVEVRRLNAALVQTSRRHGVEDISGYSLGRFLKADLKTKRMDPELKAFLYHIALCDNNFKDALAPFENGIVEFAFYCLENGMRGRYVNSVFTHALLYLCGREEQPPAAAVAAMEDELFRQIFTYELRAANPLVSHVWIAEKERRSQVLYGPSGNGWVVRATSERASVICFSAETGQIVPQQEARVTLVKRVENADARLYLHFYRKRRLSPELCIALAAHIEAQEPPAFGEDESQPDWPPYEEWIDILNDALALNDISHSFTMRMSAALGNILYNLDNRDKALAYYSGVDENFLEDKYIEQMLQVFLSAGEIEKAALLLNKKAHCIPERALFSALKRVAAFEEHRPHIADAAYELLLKSWYDKALLDVVLQHYKGSQSEWEELSKSLALISASEESLDEIIIKNSVWMHGFDEGAQKVFFRMYEHSPENSHVALFAYYCVYEIIINGVKPEYDTVVILEKLFANDPDSLLGCALCAVYLTHGITTLQSDYILAKTLEMAQSEGILPPVLKNLDINRLAAAYPGPENTGDKRSAIAYIVKNLPFIYRCAPGKTVTVRYRIDDEEEYSARKMDYLRFGLYTAKITHFYAEKVTYHFCEEMPTGSIVTKEYETVNKRVYINDSRDDTAKDPFFTINNALVYEQMFKYEQVEAVISDTLRENYRVRGGIL